MSTFMLILLAFGLAMDAFAVSITNGMCYRINPFKNALSSGVAFGFFQGLMPLIGYFAGRSFRMVIENIDHWIALILLGLIGGRMIVEAIQERRNPEDCAVREFSGKTLLVQAVATSIDALAIGVGLAAMQVNILIAVSVIGLITFGCCFTGVLIGRTVGSILKDKAEILGGAILVVIGLHIFIDHTELFSHFLH